MGCSGEGLHPSIGIPCSYFAVAVASDARLCRWTVEKPPAGNHAPTRQRTLAANSFTQLCFSRHAACHSPHPTKLATFHHATLLHPLPIPRLTPYTLHVALSAPHSTPHTSHCVPFTLFAAIFLVKLLAAA